MAYTLDQMRRLIRVELENAGLENAENQVRWLVQARTGYSLSDMTAHPDQQLDEEHVAILHRDSRALAAGKPLARVLGYSSFYGLNFALNAATLEPRVDTEILVDAARVWRRSHPRYADEGFTFLDLGTGSGCIFISLVNHWPDCRGIGIDLDESALRQARDNAEMNGVEEYSFFVCGNWCDALSGRYPLIVANPPYIHSADLESLDESVKRFDPIQALDGGIDGLCSIKKLVSITNQHLTKDGAAFFEIGSNQLDEVKRLIESAGLNLNGVHHDLGGIPRVVEICYGDNSKKN